MPQPAIFTYAEQTAKRYTVQQAVDAAKALQGGAVCVTSLHGRPMGERITLVELNEISDRIIDDTEAYDSGRLRSRLAGR